MANWLDGWFVGWWVGWFGGWWVDWSAVWLVCWLTNLPASRLDVGLIHWFGLACELAYSLTNGPRNQTTSQTSKQLVKHRANDNDVADSIANHMCLWFHLYDMNKQCHMCGLPTVG